MSRNPTAEDSAKPTSLTKAGVEHTYSCRQRVTFDDQWRIDNIVQEDMPAETAAVRAYLKRVGGPRFAIVAADAQTSFYGDGPFRLKPNWLARPASIETAG